jgi:hypothetical protein
VTELFTAEWAEQVRRAVDQGPDERLRAGKLPDYWKWIERARSGYGASWALGAGDLPGGPAYLRLGWRDGRCADAVIVGPGEPVDATFVFVADLATWLDLLAGEDPGRIVMYRRLRLCQGDVLAFFRTIYMFVEAVAAIGRIPATAPRVSA